MPWHGTDLGSLHIGLWTLFGHVPLALFFAWLLLTGLGCGWHWRSTVLAMAALVAGLSLGTALLPSVLGATAGGIGGWLLAQRALRMRRPPLASLAVALTLVVAIGRLGCLLSGCCFGRVSALPWAVQYDHGSAPWLLHHALDLVASSSASSLAVHPYPLYLSLALLLWLPVVLWLKRRLRSEASVLALTASYALTVRAGVDGTRAMVNVWWAKLGVLGGLDRLQWAMLLGALASLLIALAIERRARIEVRSAPAKASPAQVPKASVPKALATWCVFGGALFANLVFNECTDTLPLSPTSVHVDGGGACSASAGTPSCARPQLPGTERSRANARVDGAAGNAGRYDARPGRRLRSPDERE